MPRLDMSRLSETNKEGAKSLGELAHEKVKEILAKHKPAPLPEDVEKDISGILKRAEKEFGL
jgi:trimethylamine:corrinoid methyltransferase-like protein